MLEMMPGQIDHKEARKELQDFTTAHDKLKERQEGDIDAAAQVLNTYDEKRAEYGRLDKVMLWYLTELLKKHQQLAQKYDLLPMESDIIRGV